MTAPALSVRALRKSYGDVHALRGLDLEVEAGECFGLLGPNGAGKTTTVEICEGLLPPDDGDVELLGLRWDRAARALRDRIGISLQETQLSDKLTVDETVRLFRSFYRRPRPADAVLGLVALDEKRSARVGTLSGGQKQRLAVACALVGNPELLFLDEPTTGLDPQSRRQLWEIVEGLRASGRTVVLTTHYMDEAERLCDRVAIVDHGRVIALGTPRELIASIGAGHVLVFAVAGGMPFLPDELRALPGVRAVRAVDPGVVAGSDASTAEGASAWELAAAAAHATVPSLLDAIERHGAALTELRTHAPTLEDVFVSLTGRGLRDG